MATKNVIIGASAAGIACATKLRDLDKQIEILVIDAEEEIPCNRCLLSDLLAGEKTEQEIFTRDANYFKQQNIDLVLNTRVTEVIPQENCVKTQNGQKIFYDKLFLGIGKTGFIPKLQGSSLKGVFSFYGLADVRAILSFIQKNQVKHVTIVGAGLTGLECADALLEKNFKVAVVERSPHILPYQLDTAGAEIIQNLMKKNNVSFHSGQIVEEIKGDSHVRGVMLSDDGELQTDMVIFSIGGRPNIQLALRAGIETSTQGITTSSSMQTNIANIFAGGDSCAVYDLLSGEKIPSCLWSEAVIQGQVAAHNMLGISKEYPGMLVVTCSKIFGTSIVSCGPTHETNPEQQEIVKRDSDYYHKYLTQDGILKGFTMIGKTDNVGLLRKVLINKTQFTI